MFGTSSRSVRRGLATLREECPNSERNYCVGEGDSDDSPAIQASVYHEASTPAPSKGKPVAGVEKIEELIRDLVAVSRAETDPNVCHLLTQAADALGACLHKKLYE